MPLTRDDLTSLANRLPRCSHCQMPATLEVVEIPPEEPAEPPPKGKKRNKPKATYEHWLQCVACGYRWLEEQGRPNVAAAKSAATSFARLTRELPKVDEHARAGFEASIAAHVAADLDLMRKAFANAGMPLPDHLRRTERGAYHHG